MSGTMSDTGSGAESGPKSVAGVRRWWTSLTRYTRVFLTVAAIVYLGWHVNELWPSINPEASLHPEVMRSREYREASRVLAGDPQLSSVATTVALTYLVHGDVIVERDDGTVRIVQVDPRVQMDAVFLFSGVWLGILLAVAYLIQTLSTPVTGKAAGTAEQTVDEYLRQDVSGAQERAAEMLRRSTLLLSVGIVMALVGVLVFFFSLEPVRSTERVEDYLASAIRPVGILIFVESIAWFLLRQHRALIEDYKTFHRMYLKRANYLIALRMVHQGDLSDAQRLFLQSLLAEDLTGRLRTGESTEAAAALAANDPNPVFDLLQAALDRIPRPRRG